MFLIMVYYFVGLLYIYISCEWLHVSNYGILFCRSFLVFVMDDRPNCCSIFVKLNCFLFLIQLAF